MSTLFASPIDTAYRRSITRSKAGSGVHSRSSFEAAMDSVAALLANPRAGLFSRDAINVLRKQIAYTEGTVGTTDARSALIDTWAALVELAEAPYRNQKVAACQRVVVVLAEVLCHPVEMPLSHRQSYWGLLQAFLQVLGRTPGYEEALTRIDHRFPRWMDSLHAAVRHGKLQPVTAPWGNADGNKRLSAAEDLDRGRCLSPSRSLDVYDEAQYFGNSSDHWRRHTSHR